MSQAAEQTILEFVSKKLLPRKRALGVSDSLFGAGVLDSLAHLRLISFLEKEFKVSFTLREFTWENFDSVARIAALVESKRR